MPLRSRNDRRPGRPVTGWDLTFPVFAMDDPSEFKRIVSGCVGDLDTRTVLLTEAVGA